MLSEDFRFPQNPRSTVSMSALSQFQALPELETVGG